MEEQVILVDEQDREIGSIQAGKRADMVALDKSLKVRTVWIDGREAVSSES